MTDLPDPAYMGGTAAISTQPVVGTSDLDPSAAYQPGTEDLADDEIRVSILGSGLPWVTKSQAAGSVLMEVGNPQRDVFVFDLGAGSLANFSGLKVPVTSLKNVFLSHLHADHVADYLTLMGSYVKAGRLDPVEVWGGASDVEARGTAVFVDAFQQALAWDHASVTGWVPITGAQATAHEVPYNRTEVIYERNGVTITSFPVIHVLNGAVGFRVDYAGQSVVFLGRYQADHDPGGGRPRLRFARSRDLPAAGTVRQVDELPDRTGATRRQRRPHSLQRRWGGL